MDDITKTQHFTTNYDLILKNINFFPKEAVDPFAGNADLTNYSPFTNWELYDIDPKSTKVQKRDSLLNPIDYSNKTVITNPPYLAKNKTKDFDEIFKKYNTDDLYKASILSIMGCKNGILIIPINFFTDENTAQVRTAFLSKYKVTDVNVFSNQVFDSTSYNVCSFYFEQGETSKVTFHSNNSSIQLILYKEFDYRLGGEFYNKFKNIKPTFSRLTSKQDDYFPTNIFLTALDTRTEKINLSIKPQYVGKSTDRIRATLTSKYKLSNEQQLNLVNSFNSFLNENRNNYNNLILTNYRDFGRKRISFEDVYKICTLLT